MKDRLHPSSMVFVVDDEFAVRDSVRMIVQALRISVLCYESAREFLDYVDANEIVGPACLVADVLMPECDGVRLLDLLRDREWKFPAVIISGYGGMELEQVVREFGAADYIEKPFLPGDLERAIVANLTNQIVRSPLVDSDPAAESPNSRKTA